MKAEGPARGEPDGNEAARGLGRTHPFPPLPYTQTLLTSLSVGS